MVPDFRELRAGLGGVRIAHHIKGRIRLKLETVSTSFELPDDRVKAFQSILDRVPGVHSLRVNLLARSCTVEYDPAVIPAQSWDDFLAGNDSAAAAVLERILHDTYREIVNAKP